MKASYVHYYFYKNLIENVPEYISSKMKLELEGIDSESLYFNLANFNDTAIFYRLLNPFKKDKYQIYDKFHNDEFFNFFELVVEKVKLDGDIKELYLAYGMISHYILEEELEKFLATKINKKIRLDRAYNHLDSYVALKYDSINLNKTKISKLFNSFKYEAFINNAIEIPMVKSFDFLAANDYLNHCYKQMNYFYSHLTTSKLGLKKICFKLYDIFFNHKSKPKASSYFYPKKPNEIILNLNKKKYLFNDETYDYSIDEILENAKSISLKWIEAINQYIYEKKDTNFKQILKSQV